MSNVRQAFDDNILTMTRRWIIALTLGTITTVAAFAGGLWLIIAGGRYAGNELLVFVSMALAPLAAFAVVLGFAVWWLVTFLFHLLAPDQRPRE